MGYNDKNQLVLGNKADGVEWCSGSIDRLLGEVVAVKVCNPGYRISVKEKKLIEQNLQHGDVLSCTVLSIDKKQLRLKWTINDDELFRFIN